MQEKPISRAQAIAVRQRRYNTGKPCQRGHLSDRYTTSGQCVECAKEHSRERHQAVKDALAGA